MKQKLKKVLGRQIILEISQVNREKLDDIKLVKKIMINAAEIAGADVREVEFHQFKPQGITGVVVIAESHLTIHTWPELGYAAIDLFTCGHQVDPLEAVDYLIKKFEAKQKELKEIKRGINKFTGGNKPMTNYNYKKAKTYSNLGEIYKNCCGPGALKLTEFLADKMEVQAGDKLLDIGTNSGYQTCFLAKEYSPLIVGIDPWSEAVESLMQNARDWEVESNILGLETGVPDTDFADDSFDRVYSTTTLEMMRGMNGKEGYRKCIEEIYRVLKPGGIFGLGEPMHRDVEIPEEIYSYVTTGDMPAPWAECFATVEETVEVLKSVGFDIIEADEAPDGRLWWEEYAEYDPEVGDDAEVIKKDKDRWLTFGYIIAQK